MPKSLADGKTKLSIMNVQPKDGFHPTLAELNGGIDAACRVLNDGFKMGPTESDTVDEKPLCQEGNSKVPTTSNYEADITVFRYFDSTGKAETGTAGADVGDAVYQAMKTKGTELWVAKRVTSKSSLDPWAEGDEVEVYQLITDNPQDGEMTGYIKKHVPVLVVNAWLNGTVTAAAA